MKKFKLLTILIVILTILSFKTKSSDNTLSKKDFDIHHINKDKNGIIGTWINSTNSKKSKKSIADNILEIKFKKNLTAKIKVSDSNGIRVITGKWSSTETENFKKIAGNNVNLPSNSIILEYLRNGKGMNLITLSKVIKNGKVQLKSREVIFEKK
ncbi:hypothetical protein SAMN05421766_104446 [Zobellia uliginosa]|uniref:Uncharacterized protein n=1 Tax=Zobellia uliginosa TaxID=143224 RepID=A0ABY1KWF5_9FLAO|nr:hypothetical protein [Zobellia uliginosa]SIS86105.1 hypothetical protein SAMN05421766_104446 [Zobellia uliginosa]